MNCLSPRDPVRAENDLSPLTTLHSLAYIPMVTPMSWIDLRHKCFFFFTDFPIRLGRGRSVDKILVIRVEKIPLKRKDTIKIFSKRAWLVKAPIRYDVPPK